MEFYKHVQYCFRCYVIKSAGEPRKYCSVICNLLLIEINLAQIRIVDIKREKVCAVCPYLLFLVISSIVIIGKAIDNPITGHQGPRGTWMQGPQYTATALGRGRVASPMLGCSNSNTIHIMYMCIL